MLYCYISLTHSLDKNSGPDQKRFQGDTNLSFFNSLMNLYSLQELKVELRGRAHIWHEQSSTFCLLYCKPNPTNKLNVWSLFINIL